MHGCRFRAPISRVSVLFQPSAHPMQGADCAQVEIHTKTPGTPLPRSPRRFAPLRFLQSYLPAQGRPKYTTSSSQSPSEFVTIIHPSHPLCGQQVEVVRIRRGADPDLIVRFPDGHHAAIAMSCTSYAAPDHAPSPPTIHHLLDFEGLRQAAQLIGHIQQMEDPSPVTDGQAASSSEV